VTQTPIDVQLLKQLLKAFVRDRQGAPKEQLEREYGDLLMSLMKVADQLGVDLFEAAQQDLQQRSARAKRKSRATKQIR